MHTLYLYNHYIDRNIQSNARMHILHIKIKKSNKRYSCTKSMRLYLVVNFNSLYSFCKYS